MKPVIEITVKTDGQAQVQTRGFTGRSCLNVSRFLETALGKWQSERLTGEFYKQHTETETHEEETQ